MDKFEKYYVKDDRCQVCGFKWKDFHSDTERKICKATVARELKRLK